MPPGIRHLVLVSDLDHKLSYNHKNTKKASFPSSSYTPPHTLLTTCTKPICTEARPTPKGMLKSASIQNPYVRKGICICRISNSRKKHARKILPSVATTQQKELQLLDSKNEQEKEGIKTFCFALPSPRTLCSTFHTYTITPHTSCYNMNHSVFRTAVCFCVYNRDTNR